MRSTITEGARTCPGESEIVALAQGIVDATRGVALRAHVDECSDCQAVLACLMPTGEPADVGTRRERALPAGAMVGRYEVLGVLGMGAMGIVYAATDRELQRKVALKMLRGEDALATDRLVREAQALARVSHPNVIVVYEVGRFDDQIFMAMEYVDGESLRGWIAQSHGVEEVLSVFRDAGRGLAAAHRAGLVHRDFKPDNVLIARDGRVRVADFGLARADVWLASTTSPDEAGASSLRSLTRTGAILGTPAYMAPEQHDGRLADARSDQFAFAVSLYEALYGTRPFAGTTLAELSERVRSGEIPSRAPQRGRVAAHVIGALLRALETRPEDRFPTMDAMLVALDRPASNVRPILAVATALVALTGVAIFSRTAPDAEASSAAAPTTPTAPSASSLLEPPPTRMSIAASAGSITPAPLPSTAPRSSAPRPKASTVVPSAESSPGDPLDRRR